MLRKILILSLPLLSLYSCGDRLCFKTAGVTEELEIDLQSAEIIEVHDLIDLRIIQSPDQKAIVRGGSNFIKKISIAQDENQLTIRDNNICRQPKNSSDKIEVEIYTSEVKIINFFGHGNLFAENLELSSLEFNSLRTGMDIYISGSIDTLRFFMEKGSPDLYLSGNSDYLYIYHFGSGFVYAEGLQTDRIHLNHNSTGNFHVYPIEELFVELYSRGNVYFYNKPESLGGPVVGSGRILEGQ